jgi:hypothetical protein
MKRLTLTAPVTITGPSPVALGLFARQQAIEMRPLSLSDMEKTRSKDGTGWYWQTGGGTLVPIDMSLVREAKAMRAEGSPTMNLHPRHYLYFQHGKERLNCVEHILALKTLGLDGVVIKALNGSHWVPYDGRAKMYWEAIENHLKYDGYLKPMAIQLHHTYQDIDPKRGWARHVTLNSMDRRNELVVKVGVDYLKFGGREVIERHFPVDDLSNMMDVLYSRPLLQPAWLERYLKKLHWPHAENVLKPSEFMKENPDALKKEIALHRMLDLLGVIALLAESGAYVAGSLDTDMGNHATDLGFLEKLKPVARQMYPDLECLAEPPPAAPKRFFLWRPVARRSAPS